MLKKQDAASPRTATDLQRRYNFDKNFSEILGIANDANEAAKEASEAIKGLDQEKIFNLLTNNGESQGVYRDGDGNIYINASYIVSGILRSLDKNTYFDLDNGEIVTINPNNGAITTLSKTGFYQEFASGLLVIAEFLGMANTETDVFRLYPDPNGARLGLRPLVDEELTEHPIQWKTIAGVPMITDPDAEFSFTELGVNATVAELNYLSGVKSAIQAQLADLSQRIAALGG